MAKNSSIVQTSEANDRLVDYDCKKTTQALNYLLQKSKSHSLNKIALVKLLWAADRYHVRNYGRLVANEVYVAMENGPVGSLAKDIMYEKVDFGLPQECLAYTSSFIKKEGDIVSTLKETEVDYLSETDREALDFAWKNFGNLKLEELVEFAHKYPEWDKHAEDLEVKKTRKSKSIDLFDFYKEPKNVQNDPFAIDENRKSISEEIFAESAAIKAILKS